VAGRVIVAVNSANPTGEVLGEYLGGETEVLRGFPQPFQANTGILSRLDTIFPSESLKAKK
jgi:hypothetical protein